MSGIALPFDDFNDIPKIVELQLKQDMYQQEAPPSPPHPGIGRRMTFERNALGDFIAGEKKQTFVWDEEACLEFCKLVAKMGVNNVKPKRLLTYFPKKYKVTIAQLGSHLQKYRNRLVKDYSLFNSAQI